MGKLTFELGKKERKIGYAKNEKKKTIMVVEEIRESSEEGATPLEREDVVWSGLGQVFCD